MGLTGIVRADTWEDAYECAEDELFPEADQTWEGMAEDCDHKGPIDTLPDAACWQEAYGFRPNGPNATDTFHHGVYAKDLNGEALDRLTPALAKHLKLEVFLSFPQDY
jgi:hypothetical protein